jgi:energy-coupling factor transporter ATP-binding protein EcfA2
MRRAAEDPFGEHAEARWRARLCVLGGDFTVDSDDAALLGLAVEAFGGMPKHRLERRPHRFRARLVLTNHTQSWARASAPPRPVLGAGEGLLCATVDAGNFAIVDASMSRALVCVSKAMLRHRYHARYELVELAFLTLAARAQSLVPLHAACVGANGKGVLLMGASGTGKSTLSLHALAGGMQFLSEDSAFVAVESLRVTGVPSYLHLGWQTLRFLEPEALRRAIARSPTIERRSGARKLEVDLRELDVKVARAPLRLAATVFLSRRKAGRQPTLRALGRDALIARLRREQPYASATPNWRAFERRIVDEPAYELPRTEHPDIAVRLLGTLL